MIEKKSINVLLNVKLCIPDLFSSGIVLVMGEYMMNKCNFEKKYVFAVSEYDFFSQKHLRQGTTNLW